jgi:hypothetical protein
MPKCGYLYVVYGEQYFKEVITSAESLKRVDKDSHITLVADKEYKSDLFDKVIVDPIKNEDIDKIDDLQIKKSAWSKTALLALKQRIKWIGKFMYENTFFVDTDTYFYENCRTLFGLLDYFDICVAMAPRGIGRIYIEEGNNFEDSIVYNLGLIVYRKNAENDFLFKEWYRRYEKELEEGLLEGWRGTQEPFVAAFMTSKSRLHGLPNEYNARLPCYITLNKSVKIVHGRYDDYEKLRSLINTPSSHRCWDPVRKKIIC